MAPVPSRARVHTGARIWATEPSWRRAEPTGAATLPRISAGAPMWRPSVPSGSASSDWTSSPRPRPVTRLTSPATSQP